MRLSARPCRATIRASCRTTLAARSGAHTLWVLFPTSPLLTVCQVTRRMTAAPGRVRLPLPTLGLVSCLCGRGIAQLLCSTVRTTTRHLRRSDTRATLFRMQRWWRRAARASGASAGTTSWSPRIRRSSIRERTRRSMTFPLLFSPRPASSTCVGLMVVKMSMCRGLGTGGGSPANSCARAMDAGLGPSMWERPPPLSSSLSSTVVGLMMTSKQR
mmetsp:Transcript_29202/g.77144  ORF Transcript_29202/g.77144 Transcript_29202/m.77144 type:complete len:215 (+) Transcript_29202:1687-2331(+)